MAYEIVLVQIIITRNYILQKRKLKEKTVESPKASPQNIAGYDIR